MTRKAVICVPTLTTLTQPCADSLAASVPAAEAAGWNLQMTVEQGNPYISGARAAMLHKVLQTDADVVVFIDYDLSWRPEDMVALLETPGDVVAGTYRFKKPDEEYMGGWFVDERQRPVLRDDGCFKANRIPAGFLKVTIAAVRKFMAAYPELLYGDTDNPAIDLFNHGAIDGVWYGEDYAFAKRWVERCGDIWLIPTLEITHHSASAAFPGNLHEYMMRQPGGINDPERTKHA